MKLLKDRGKVMRFADFMAWIVIRTGENMFVIRRVVEAMKARGEVSYDDPLDISSDPLIKLPR